MKPGRKKAALTKAELTKLKRTFTRWFYRAVTRDEMDWAGFYGPYRGEASAFVACCIGYLMGKERAKKCAGKAAALVTGKVRRKTDER
jgi:hypothetical protein